MKNLCLAVAIVAMSCSNSMGQTVSHGNAVLKAVANVTIASEAPGIVREVHVDAGEDVRSSQPVVTLNQETFAAEFRVAVEEEAIASIRANNTVDIAYARKSTDVNRKLLKRSERAREEFERSITQTELDRLGLELQRSALSTEQAEIELVIAQKTETLRQRMREVAEVKLRNRTIRAPLDGNVAQLFVQVGEWVNAGDPIARVVDLNRLRIQAVFDEDYVHTIKPGDKGTFESSIGGNSTVRNVVVTYVGSEIADGIFQVWADIDNSDGTLVPGSRGKLTLSIDSDE